MKHDSLDQWLSDLKLGKASLLPAELPDPVLQRLASYSNNLLQDSDIPDPVGDAAMLTLAISVTARKQGFPKEIRSEVREMLHLQRGIATQVILEKMRRAGAFEVTWPEWGFCSLDEQLAFRPIVK